MAKEDQFDYRLLDTDEGLDENESLAEELGVKAKKKRDLSKYLDLELVEQNRFKINPALLEEFNVIEPFIVKNVQIQTQLKVDIISQRLNQQDADELEDYRCFPRGFLREKGVFFSESVNDLIKAYPMMSETDLFRVENDAYEGRYMLPLCLPNGMVFTFMGYCPPKEHIAINPSKYKLANMDWINQGNLLGNMESLSKYTDKKIIYLCEGMMDAYRLESVFKAPSLAILGSSLTDTKLSLLYLLKQEGYTLIYVPDEDSSGLNDFLMHAKLIDNYMHIPRSEDDSYKDFDKYVAYVYVNYILENHKKMNLETKPEKTPVSVLSDEIIEMLNEKVRKSMIFEKSEKTILKRNLDDFEDLMASIGNDIS